MMIELQNLSIGAIILVSLLVVVNAILFFTCYGLQENLDAQEKKIEIRQQQQQHEKEEWKLEYSKRARKAQDDVLERLRNDHNTSLENLRKEKSETDERFQRLREETDSELRNTKQSYDEKIFKLKLDSYEQLRKATEKLEMMEAALIRWKCPSCCGIIIGNETQGTKAEEIDDQKAEQLKHFDTLVEREVCLGDVDFVLIEGGEGEGVGDGVGPWVG